MTHIIDIDTQREELFPIFKNMKEGNSILFLGAGASIGEKKYLSNDLISYYEANINKSLNESNITKWIDMLSADPDFTRSLLIVLSLSV